MNGLARHRPDLAGGAPSAMEGHLTRVGPGTWDLTATMTSGLQRLAWRGRNVYGVWQQAWMEDLQHPGAPLQVDLGVLPLPAFGLLACW